MPQLLLELFSEEIPARMQKRAEEDLAKAFGEKLKAAGIDAKAIKTFSAPRRLGLFIDDLPAKAADVNEEKKGPRVGSPDQAIQGFLKSAGLKSIEEAQIVEDKKGSFYVAKIERAGRATTEVVQEIIPEIIRAFPWPKSMRSQSSDLQWVRPLHNICCVFDGKAVKIAVEGVGSEAVTWGHRFHAPEALPVTSAADHASKLRGAKVLIEREERKTIILEQAKKLCAAKGLELVEDIGLLEEVAGLVEWPVVLLGDMDPTFLDLPGEVIRLSMRTHQKYFAVRRRRGRNLAPHFIVVANVEAKDGGRAIAAGNARVLSARLNDARFFWDTDQRIPLGAEERLAKLQKIVFHQLLGSVWDKAERAKEIGVWIAHSQSKTADLSSYVRCVVMSAALSKADLVTETVGEFPELQGQIGKQLFELEFLLKNPGANETAQREAASIGAAIEDHYRPVGANDRVAEDRIAYTLAIADKVDTLLSFWLIDEKPTGSRDPYALRRAGIGLIRTIVENRLRIRLRELFEVAYQVFIFDWREGQGSVWPVEAVPSPIKEGDQKLLVFSKWENGAAIDFDRHPMLGFFKTENFDEPPLSMREMSGRLVHMDQGFKFVGYKPQYYTDQLLTFLVDRLKVQLREQGKRHDLVDAVFALGDDDLVRIIARVEALDAFLETEDGANLLAAYRRAANIVEIEEKKIAKGGLSDSYMADGLDAAILTEPAEKALYEALEKALPAARAAVEKEEFAAAMKALSGLRAPVDAFFEKVLVNAEEPLLRRNRLLLLSRLREALSAVADFSKIEG